MMRRSPGKSGDPVSVRNESGSHGICFGQGRSTREFNENQVGGREEQQDLSKDWQGPSLVGKGPHIISERQRRDHAGSTTLLTPDGFPNNTLQSRGLGGFQSGV